MVRRFALVIAVVIALVGCSPKELSDPAYKMERWPGQRLGGTEQPVPADFDFVNQSVNDVIQLKVQGDILPHVVNLWGVGMGDSIYVWTDPASGWSQRIEKRPDAWVRVGDSVYALSSATVEDAGQRQLVFEAFVAKYGEEMRSVFGELEPTIAHTGVFYRLAPRS